MVLETAACRAELPPAPVGRATQERSWIGFLSVKCRGASSHQSRQVKVQLGVCASSQRDRTSHFQPFVATQECGPSVARVFSFSRGMENPNV